MKSVGLAAVAALFVVLPAQAETLSVYATQCALELGVTSVPGYSCSNGYTNSGANFFVPSANNRAGKVGTSNPNVDAVFLCRNYNSTANTAALNGYILQNVVTGSTCFFDATGNGSGTVPSPNAANATTYWRDPAAMDGQCQTCHSADPFIVTSGLAPTMNAINMISKTRNLKGVYDIVGSNNSSSHFYNWNAERNIAALPCASACHQSSTNTLSTNMVNAANSQGWMTQPAYLGKAELYSASIGVWRPGAQGYFYLDWDYTRTWDNSVDRYGAFGTWGDKPFVLRGTRCELGTSNAEFGTVRGNTWLVTRNNYWYDAADDAAAFTYGSSGTPVSWNGVPVSYQGSSFVVDYNASRTATGDKTFVFGLSTDLPIIGRWKRGIGRRIGTFRSSGSYGYFYLDTNGNNAWDGADAGFQFGDAGDIPVVGDFFNSDGIDEIGVFRNGTWFIDKNNNHQWDGVPGGDAEWYFGEAGDIPVVSPTKWNCGTL